jgi:peptidyl-prolyl cis-trans isomerase A (cyclophilin A)
MRILLSLLALSTAAWGQKASVAIVIETELGNIEATVDTAAPATAQNFLHYVDAGLYNNGIFHRTVKPDNQPNNDVKIEVIQGGPAADSKGFPPIALERTSVTGLRHKNGTLSMARSQPDSATSDFFICIGDQPSLDYGGKRNPDGQGFAAFGVVTSGMELVRRIQNSPSEAQKLRPPVKILKISRR